MVKDQWHWPPDDAWPQWPDESQASGSGNEWHNHNAEGEEGHEECRKWDYNSKGTAVAYKRPYQGKSKGKAKGKGKGKWEGYGAASSGCGDAWPDHIHEGKGKGKVKGYYARPGPYESPRANKWPVLPQDGHWPPDGDAPDPNVEKTDKKAEEEKPSKDAMANAKCLLKAMEIANSIKVTGNMSPGGPKFASAINIMEVDKDKFWVQPKRDPNGYISDYCLLCKKYMNYEHIGYGATSTHRKRRQDPSLYFSLDNLKQWEESEAQRIKQEDEDQEEARKKDEGQKTEEAMARGDISLDVGEAPVPMATEEHQAALVKALVSLAAM